MPGELSIELREYLERCGLSKRRIARCTGNTRMYHDLGLYGDIAEGYMEAPVDRYHVDLSGFEFDRFFPPEFPGDDTFLGRLLSIVPFANYVGRRRKTYSPLTLQTMEDVLRAKQWRAVEHR